MSTTPKLLLALCLGAVLAGCPPEDPALDIVLDTADAYDECNICVQVTATSGDQPAAGAGLRRAVDDSTLEPAGELDENGQAEVCFNPMKPGDHQVTVGVTSETRNKIATADILVHPFGYDIGILKPTSEEDLANPVPSVVPDPDNPVLELVEDTWEGDTLMLASVAPHDDGYLMLYGGRGDDYEIGAATSPDGLAWTRVSDEPVMSAGFAGDWSADAVNAPSVLHDGDGYLAWFHASAGEAIAIGLARSSDGITWEADPESPVLEAGADDDWDHGSIGHPAVLARDGAYEMWYASASHQIGHAISTDGVTWDKYCLNPVFVPLLQLDTWESGAAKSPEVVLLDGTYHLFYSAGGQGNWQVGHAASTDGLRWARSSDTPVLPRGEAGEWDEAGTINAFALDEGGDLTFWYTGISTGPSAIGIAELEGWE